MSRQKTITKKVTRKKTAKDKPIGFYKKGGKTRPIIKAKGKTRRKVVKRVVSDPDRYVSKRARASVEKYQCKLFSIDRTPIYHTPYHLIFLHAQNWVTRIGDIPNFN